FSSRLCSYHALYSFPTRRSSDLTISDLEFNISLGNGSDPVAIDFRIFLELDQNRSISSYEYSSFSDKKPTVVRLSSKFKPRISTELLISLIRLSFINRRIISGSICL